MQPRSLIRLRSSELNDRVKREMPISRARWGAPVSASHTRTVLSYEPDASRRPSCEKATDQTQDVCPSSARWGAPVSVSHTRTVLSSEPDASRRPSCEKATDLTEDVCPSSARWGAPVSASHTRTVLSPEPDASRRPSCEKATDVTQDVCPSSVYKQGLQSSLPSGLVLIHCGLSFSNNSLIILLVGQKMRADRYT